MRVETIDLDGNSGGARRELIGNYKKTFTVKFNGAPPANYYFAVTSKIYGRLNASSISFKTSSTVTNISPKSGSVLGGTVLTITGTNFSNEKTDLAVKVGDFLCDILTASTT